MVQKTNIMASKKLPQKTLTLPMTFGRILGSPIWIGKYCIPFPSAMWYPSLLGVPSQELSHAIPKHPLICHDSFGSPKVGYVITNHGGYRNLWIIRVSDQFLGEKTFRICFNKTAFLLTSGDWERRYISVSRMCHQQHLHKRTCFRKDNDWMHRKQNKSIQIP